MTEAVQSIRDHEHHYHDHEWEDIPSIPKGHWAKPPFFEQCVICRVIRYKTMSTVEIEVDRGGLVLEGKKRRFRWKKTV